ncbi:MAG: hypothetical protein E7530_08125 [Ruminococcaceae bacterium]|nr:hypothetical protein [Oscillospiraceae bacterium]
MSFKVFVTKYINQLKAINPKYDEIFSINSDEPIEFLDGDNVRVSFASIADTHLVDNEAATVNLNNFFTDLANSKNRFDAVLMAGDIAEYGRNKEYNRFFRVFDNFKNDYKLFITMGNHDVRFTFGKNQKIIMNKVEEYLGIKTNGKSFYSYDINGYTFIVIGTEKRVLEKAHITKEQIDFLDKELKRATKDGKPAFVMCHQAFAETHGLPEVWKTGDMGEQNDDVRAVMEKYKNVFFINGHLHGGVFEKTFEVLNEENGVYSLSVPGYRKKNNFGYTDSGTGYYGEVYDDKVVFTARKFVEGKRVDAEYSKFVLELK